LYLALIVIILVSKNPFSGKLINFIIIIIIQLLLLLLLLLLQVKPEITIYNYISHKKIDIRQRNKMMAEKGNF